METLIITFSFLLFTFFWAILFWRFMRAHEKLADSVEWIAKLKDRQQQSVSSKDDD